MFGFTEEQFTGFGLTVGVGAFMLYMLLVIAQLAWASKAGKFGTFVLVMGLAFGMLGFVAKGLIQWLLGGWYFFGIKLWIKTMDSLTYPQLDLVYQSCSSKHDTKKSGPRTPLEAMQVHVRPSHSRLVHRKQLLLLLPLLKDIKL